MSRGSYSSPLLESVAARRRRWVYFKGEAGILHAVSRSCNRTLCDLTLGWVGIAPLSYREVFDVALVQSPSTLETVGRGRTVGSVSREIPVCLNCARHPSFGLV